MKSIFYSICALFAFSFAASAQSTLEEKHDDDQEKIQQQAPRETQQTVENAATQTNPNAQNKKDLRAAEDKIKKEKEKSTGKQSKNPAAKNTTTGQPAKLNEPDSKPLKK